ncbi:MAG TPA: hypothetical protein VIG42_09715 [Solirubrobacteraceae bacterium]|jgi:hypothetical protein
MSARISLWVSRSNFARHLSLLVIVLAACAVGALATSAGGAQTASTGKVKCPIKASSSSSPVEWAFTESSPPSGAHKGIASSYTHGKGRWQGGKATGTVCHEDSLTGGKGSRNLVLAMAGGSKLSPRVTRLGLLGVELALKVRVAASDDTACPVGTAGTVTLFASYYATHRDSLALSFGGACADHDHRYGGGSLHVLITRQGAQVNSA